MNQNLVDGESSGNSKRFFCLIIFIILSFVFLITTIVFIILYINAKNDSDGKNSENNPIEDRYINILSKISETEGAYVKQGKHDIPNSKYFNYIDIYNTKSSGSLILLEKFKTYQQTSEYSCGLAAIIMAVHYLDGTVLNETELAIIAGTNEVNGTRFEGLERAISEKGYTFDSKSKYTTKDPPSKNRTKFSEYIKETLKKNESIIVASNDWDGHYSVIIGYDDMGTKDNLEDDIIILADPYDTTDHMSDGYTIFNYERFYAQMKIEIFDIPEENYYFNVIKRKNK